MKTHTEQFYNRVSPEPNSGCWLWIGMIGPSGYGVFSSGKRKSNQQAHRVSYELHVGSIPKGMFVCHKCDVRSCVNPEHLFLGTNQDNMIDAARKKRCRAQKLDTEDIIAIKVMLRAGWSSRGIAGLFNVTDGMIGHIKCGRKWAHVKLPVAA